VIGGVVLNPENRTGVVVASDLLQKTQVGIRVEYGVTSIEELGRMNIDAPKDFHASPLPGGREGGLMSLSGPSPMQCGVLPKGCFVGMNQGGPLGSGVFFRFG